MTTAEMKAEIARLKAEIAAQPKVNAITFKVSEKKALSVYGLGRFPVTLYAGQWRRLIEALPNIQTALETHKAELAEKAAPTPANVEVPATK